MDSSGRMSPSKSAVIKLILLCVASSWAVSVIIEEPVSVIASVGQNAQFHCTGTGIVLWMVDGVPHHYNTIENRGIFDVTNDDISSGTVQSNLTVPATSVNNGTTVQCAIYSQSSVALSNNATLTILSGIGQVLNVRFSPSFSTIMWDPPPTVGVLSNLTYHLTVTNMNTGVVIINTTTTDTSYPIDDVKHCTLYKANVTATTHKENFRGDIAIIKQRSPGEYYKITSTSQNVTFNYYNGISLSAGVFLKVFGLACLHQKLQFITTNQFGVINNAELMINGSGYTEIDLTHSDGIKKDQFYSINASVVDNEGVVQNSTLLNFKTFAVQDCDVHTDHISYIIVDCTFAINSTAPGFVLIQDEHSQYTINTTLQRHEGDVSKGSVNIPDLPAGEYNLSVFDQIMEYLYPNGPAAYIHDEQVVISYFTSLSWSSVSSSARFYSGENSGLSTLPDITPIASPNSTAEFLTVVISTISAVAGIILFVGIMIIMSCIIYHIWHHTNCRREGKFDIPGPSVPAM